MNSPTTTQDDERTITATVNADTARALVARVMTQDDKGRWCFGGVAYWQLDEAFAVAIRELEDFFA